MCTPRRITTGVKLWLQRACPRRVFYCCVVDPPRWGYTRGSESDEPTRHPPWVTHSSVDGGPNESRRGRNGDARVTTIPSLIRTKAPVRFWPARSATPLKRSRGMACFLLDAAIKSSRLLPQSNHLAGSTKHENRPP